MTVYFDPWPSTLAQKTVHYRPGPSTLAQMTVQFGSKPFTFGQTVHFRVTVHRTRLVRIAFYLFILIKIRSKRLKMTNLRNRTIQKTKNGGLKEDFKGTFKGTTDSKITLAVGPKHEIKVYL